MPKSSYITGDFEADLDQELARHKGGEGLRGKDNAFMKGKRVDKSKGKFTSQRQMSSSSLKGVWEQAGEMVNGRREGPDHDKY